MTTVEEAFMSMFCKPQVDLKCSHKNRFLKCRECEGAYCSKCIQLEIHSCPKLDERSKNEKNKLSENLVQIVAPKIIKI